MDVKTFANITYNAWNEAGGEDAIRNGMRRLGYTAHYWKNPMATIFDVGNTGTDNERESLAVDFELIRDYVKNNGGN